MCLILPTLEAVVACYLKYLGFRLGAILAILIFQPDLLLVYFLSPYLVDQPAVSATDNTFFGFVMLSSSLCQDTL
jgi:hypothetical protein